MAALPVRVWGLWQMTQVTAFWSSRGTPFRKVAEDGGVASDVGLEAVVAGVAGAASAEELAVGEVVGGDLRDDGMGGGYPLEVLGVGVEAVALAADVAGDGDGRAKRDVGDVGDMLTGGSVAVLALHADECGGGGAVDEAAGLTEAGGMARLAAGVVGLADGLEGLDGVGVEGLRPVGVDVSVALAQGASPTYSPGGWGAGPLGSQSCIPGRRRQGSRRAGRSRRAFGSSVFIAVLSLSEAARRAEGLERGAH